MICTIIDGHVCWNSIRRLSFLVCQPSKTNFRLQQTNGSLMFLFAIYKRKLPFSVSAVFSCECARWCGCVCVFVYMYIYLCLYLYLYAAVSNGKRNLPFAHRVNESYPFANGLNGLAHLVVSPSSTYCRFVISAYQIEVVTFHPISRPLWCVSYLPQR